MSERLIEVGQAVAADIAAQVSGADVATFGFSLEDTGDLQIKVLPMDQIDEDEDRDGGAYRMYGIQVVVRQQITRTDTAALIVALDLALAIAKRYPVNGDLGNLEPTIASMAGVVLNEKPFFPLYNQLELDSTDYFHSVLVLNFRESV